MAEINPGRIWFPDKVQAKAWLFHVRTHPMSIILAHRIALQSYGARLVCLLP